MTPLLTITVYGTPAPQGSKRHVGGGRMIEMSKRVKPWREAVKYAALDALADWNPDAPGALPLGPDDRERIAATFPIDGPVEASMVFTVRDKPASRPAWWPAGRRWSRTLHWPAASVPDLSKLLRATEDALTDAGVWKDDARVVRYRDLAKVYVGDPDQPDALHVPGALIKIWEVE